ncbi:MAG: ATPase [Alphaproteobacteria bacterium]|nr:ATPase [Alphaproteobacteria bacterium]
MQLTRSQFLNLPRKAVTLMGMSGVGKSTLTDRLVSRGWSYYGCDEQIGARYLAEAASQTTEGLASFLGKLGDPAKGGLPLPEFRRRQQLYGKAEVASLLAAKQALHSTSRDFVLDSTGSLCEVEDEALLADLGGQTLFVYIKASEDEEAEILRRAEEFPKPLYFPPAFLEEQIVRYVEEKDLFNLEQADPLDFSRWVFPHLFRARLPKYERLARLYGVAIPSAALRDVSDDNVFLEVIADALPET